MGDHLGPRLIVLLEPSHGCRFARAAVANFLAGNSSDKECVYLATLGPLAASAAAAADCHSTVDSVMPSFLDNLRCHNLREMMTSRVVRKYMERGELLIKSALYDE